MGLMMSRSTMYQDESEIGFTYRLAEPFIVMLIHLI